MLEATFSDKKMEAGKIKFIVLKEIGSAIIDKEVSVLDMKDALYKILGEE